MVTPRDEQIAEAIVRLGAMTTDQVARAFFEGASALPSAQRRLRALEQENRVRRSYALSRSKGSSVWLAPRFQGVDVKGRLLVSDIWVALDKPIVFVPGFTLGSVRADAIFELAGVPFLLEVARSRKDIAQRLERYDTAWREFRWRRTFKTFPHLLLVVPEGKDIDRAFQIPSPPKTVCTTANASKALNRVLPTLLSNGGQ